MIPDPLSAKPSIATVEAKPAPEGFPPFAMARLSRRRRTITFVVLLLSVAAVFYALNWLTPLLCDDFGMVTSMRAVTNVREFVGVLRTFYVGWDGRLVGSFFGRLFAMFDKSVFNVANTFAFVLLTVLMYAHVRGRERLSPLLYAFVLLGVWFLVPAFGQVFLWLTGSTVYLWPMLFILAFMLPYRLHVDRPSRDRLPFALLVFVAGVAAGWSSTNLSLGVIVWVALVMRFCAKRNLPLTRWMWCGLAGAVIGFVALVAAPGNYVRNAAAGGSGLLERLFRYLFWLANERAIALALLFATVLTVGLITSRLRRHDPAVGLSLIYCAAAVVAAAVMIAAPDYPLRAFSGSAVLVIVASGLLVARLKLPDRTMALPIVVAAVLCVVGAGAQLAGAAYDIKATKDQTVARGQYIEQQKAAGNLDVTVTAIVPKTTYNPLYKLYDVTGSPTFWTNQHLATYYGVHSITGRLADD